MRFVSPSALAGRVALWFGGCRLPNLSRFGVSSSIARFPKSPHARTSSLRFSAFRNAMGAVRRVATREMLSVRFDSPQLRGRRPLKGGGRNAGASRSCQRIWRLLTRSTDLPRRTASIGSSSAAGHAPRLLLHAAFRYPRSLRTARPGRRSAADCSATSPSSAALLGFKFPSQF